MELLVSMAVSALILAEPSTSTTQVQEGYGQQFETAAAEQEARYALDWIQRLLRQAGSNPFAIRTSACVGAGLLPAVSGLPAVVRDPNGDGVDAMSGFSRTRALRTACSAAPARLPGAARNRTRM